MVREREGDDWIGRMEAMAHKGGSRVAHHCFVAHVGDFVSYRVSSKLWTCEIFLGMIWNSSMAWMLFPGKWGYWGVWELERMRI
jgi:hypothetical protein